MSLGPSMIERMGAYQRTIGLKPIGLHRPTADRLLRSLSQRCRLCAGDGFRPVGTCWLWCEGCDGLVRSVVTARKDGWGRACRYCSAKCRQKVKSQRATEKRRARAKAQAEGGRDVKG